MGRLLPRLGLLPASPAAAAAQYTAKGELIPPADYRDGVFLTSSLDLNYEAGPTARPIAGKAGNYADR